MEIKKVLTIESPVHFYRILESNNELVDHAVEEIGLMLRHYVDVAFEFMYGCKCELDENWTRLQTEYDVCSKSSELQSHLCGWLGCDRVDFSVADGDDYYLPPVN